MNTPDPETPDPDKPPPGPQPQPLSPHARKLIRSLRAAEGYLELHMPSHALRALREIPDPAEHQFIFHLLHGLALRDLADFPQALLSLEAAAAINPNSVSLQMALAWCYKRTDRLPLAILATEFAHHLDPKEPILMYNLACYLSLAQDKDLALSWLGRALRADPKIVHMIPHESDFDPLRQDPDFVKMIQLASPPPKNQTDPE